MLPCFDANSSREPGRPGGPARTSPTRVAAALCQGRLRSVGRRVAGLRGGWPPLKCASGRDECHSHLARDRRAVGPQPAGTLELE